MSKHAQKPGFILHLSILCCILLTIIPWSPHVTLFQPHWVAIMIAYWSLNAANSQVMYVAFGYGLILDVLTGSLLGKHGMSLVALSFLITKSAKKLRMTSFWQLLIMVLFWLFNDIVIRGVIDWVSFNYQPKISDLLPLLAAALIWPWVKYFMDRMRTSMRTN